ncbi:MAG: DUF2092 domain-containing protein [Terrimicrobiaceae bacterium]
MTKHLSFTLSRFSVFAFLALAPAFLHAAERIDPQALASLKRMSSTLAAAKAFTYQSKTILEVPATTGQFVTLFSTGEIALKRPDKVRARMGGDAPSFDMFYDGATLSAFAPGTKVFSTSKAPPTIDAMLQGLREETGIRFASSPLLFSDPYAVLTRGLTSAVVVGPSVVDGTACEHLAFRSPGVNWEIWIEAAPRALPRRLAVTFTDQTNFPRTLVDFSHWNLRPWLRDGDFVFHQPAGAREIPFASVLKSAGR